MINNIRFWTKNIQYSWRNLGFNNYRQKWSQGPRCNWMKNKVQIWIFLTKICNTNQGFDCVSIRIARFGNSEKIWEFLTMSSSEQKSLVTPPPPAADMVLDRFPNRYHWLLPPLPRAWCYRFWQKISKSQLYFPMVISASFRTILKSTFLRDK